MRRELEKEKKKTELLEKKKSTMGGNYFCPSGFITFLSADFKCKLVITDVQAENILPAKGLRNRVFVESAKKALEDKDAEFAKSLKEARVKTQNAYAILN